MLKQSLYAYDFDQTYDLLWAEGISWQILGKISFISNWLFSDNLNYMPVCLIDRYTPDNLPWAKNWSDLNYEVLRILSKTHLIDNPQLMGTPAGLEPAITWNQSLNPNNFGIAPIPQSILVTNNQNNPISLTWLELAFNSQSGNDYRSQSYFRSCKIFNKRKLIVSPNQSYRLNPVQWLRNSLVISEPDRLTIQTESDADLESLLYSELESQLETILQSLGLTEFRILSSIDLNIDYTLEFKDYTTIGSTLIACVSKIDIPTYSNPTYTEIPEWYFFASLIRADNPWGNLDDTDGQDKGKPVSVTYNNNRLNLTIWNLEYITFDGSLFPSYTVDDRAVYFQFQADDHQPSTVLNWQWDFTGDEDRYKVDENYWTGLIGYVIPQSSSFPIVNRWRGWLDNNNPFPVRRWFDSTFYKLNKNLFFTNGSHNNRPIYFSPDNLWCSANGSSRYIFLQYPQYQPIVQDVYGGIYTTQSAINGCNSDWERRPWLVSSYSAFLFFPRSQIVSLEDFAREFDTGPTQEGSQHWYSIDHHFSIEVYHENIDGEVRASRMIEETLEEPIEVLTRTIEQINTFIGFVYSREGSKTFTIALQFWEEEPDGKDLFTDDQVKSIVDGIQLSEAEPDSIVMPDSIRIKEIHAALQADKFANDPNDLDVLRVANLGYYIERISRVLGISVDPDGSIRSIRQSRLIPVGEEIPAGWPIGQWGRNQGNDRDGQRGGSESEDRDGTAYEVRSNRFTVNRFTGEADKIESGGYILCENWPQLIHVLLDDLDKGLGWQESGAMVIPDANNQGRWATYEGLNSLVAETAYMLSDLSQNIKGGHISGLISQATLYEVLGAIGLPYNFKPLKVEAEGAKTIHYPALEPNAPTLVDLIYLVLENLAPLVGSKINLYPEREENE